MNENRPTLTEAIAAIDYALTSGYDVNRGAALVLRDHARDGGRRPVQIVETDDELRDLPVDTIVRDHARAVCVKTETAWLGTDGSRGQGASDGAVSLPARVVEIGGSAQ